MPKIKEETEQTFVTLEQEQINYETEKLLVQQHSIKLQAISLLTIFFIAGSLVIQVFAILERNELDREQNALNLITESNEVFNQARGNSITRFITSDSETNNQNNLCLKFIGQQENLIAKDTINNPCPPAIDLTKTRSDIFNTLNFLEIVALSYKNNVADKRIIEDYFKQPAIEYINKLDQFVQEVNRDNGHTNWKEIRSLVKNWQKQK